MKLDNVKYFKPDTKHKNNRCKVAYDVLKHKLFSYDKHEKNGDVISKNKVIGNTHNGDMIVGLGAINKVVFR
ncbi:MAG: hypothetical protein HC836_39320 [Richelia sp. RM2_1_2]|nr:hypothetical protein [Richelia sp. RM2_1_2]